MSIRNQQYTIIYEGEVYVIKGKEAKVVTEIFDKMLKDDIEVLKVLSKDLKVHNEHTSRT